MSKKWKKHLSILLAAVMALSLWSPATRAAEDDGGTQTSASGVALETEDLDSASLGIKKLGEIGEGGEDEIIEPSEAIDLESVVRVSVFLEQPGTVDAGYSAENIAESSSAIAYRNNLKAQQAAVTRTIESALGHSLEVKWNLTLLVNAISAYVKYGEIEKISGLPGVKSVELETRYEPQTDEAAEPQTANTSTYMTGAAQAWTDGYTGAGSRIAVIDTGLDTTHQSFNADAFNYAINQLDGFDKSTLLTSAYVTSIKSQLNSGSANYLSAKIPYAYNYVDGNTTVNHLSDTQGEHGSHVAGIAAANRYLKSGSSYVEAAETVYAVGMAPDAQLLVMKVFGSGGGAYDSDYMAAIEDAVVLQCDAANLSLGSSVPGWTFSNSYQTVLNNLADGSKNTGMVVSISAGNNSSMADNLGRDLYIEDNYMHTGGSPGSFISSLGTASAENTGMTGEYLLFNGSQKVFFFESTSGSDGTSYNNPAISTIASSYSYVYIEGTGTAAEYQTVNSTLPLSGKVVIVNRGDISFAEKGNNASSYSPKAVIIANNQNGSIYMDLSDLTGKFPMVAIPLADAETLKESSTKNTAGGITYYTGTVTVNASTVTDTANITAREDAEMSSFSSWGISGSLIMKPEITAPGGNIWSVYGTNKTSSGTAGGSDQYEFMSGTSMAAPHIAGLSAVAAQYVKDKEIEVEGFTRRAVIQSLLMSTATPMINNGEYVSLLQQGAGLAEVSHAISTTTILMMKNAGLTTDLGMAADGKVKAELGDDPGRTGTYTYSFDIYNVDDVDHTYELSTDLFTHDAYKYEGLTYMDQATTALSAAVTYDYEKESSADHDVDQDGDTDSEDAQAVLDYLSGKRGAAGLDLSAGEMDGDGQLTTYDAYLLLNYTAAQGSDALIVKAGSSKTVTVTITLTDAQKAALDEVYTGGAYVMGFTYVNCVSETADGGLADAVEHSIPILAYYGSWTDAPMFDNNSYTDEMYGSEKVPYSGVSAKATNYLTVKYNGTTTKFTGNPYMVEEEFPADRLAVSSYNAFVNIYYNLVRAAGTTGFAVSKLDERSGKVTSVLSSSVAANDVDGLWYYYSTNTWNNTGTKFYSVNKTPASYGLSEGDVFRIGFYAVPEYNAVQTAGDKTAAGTGALSAAGFRNVLLSNVLGGGAFVGFDFVVDNTDPVVGTPTLSGKNLTVSATDNEAIAYIAVLSLDGNTVYAQTAPGTAEATLTIDASDAIANAHGYVALFVADYAGNEVAKAVKVNDNAYETKTVYVLTNTITAGDEYLIVNRNTAGSGVALGHSGTTVATNNVTVNAGTSDTNNAVYIDSADVASTSVWTISAASNFTIKNGNYYLRRNSNTGTTLQASTTNSYNTWTWSGTNNRLSMTISNRSYYLRYNNGFSLNTATNSVYLYHKTTITTEVDPYSVTSVTITPGSLDLYKGNETDLIAKVLPLTAEDRTVTWSSSNTSVATVDADGHVKAVAAGTATITATANGDKTKSASCSVSVTSVNKTLYGIIWDEEGGVYFSSFNANSLPSWTKNHTTAKSLELASAFMYSTSALYAGTLDTSSAESVIYSVNRTSYNLTEYGTNYIWATDMAVGASNSTYANYVGFAYTFAYYLVAGPIAPGDDGDGGTYSGLPYALLNCNETTGGAYFVGIACKTRSTTGGTYYVLDENGVIWQTTLSYSNGFSFSTPTMVLETGIGTSFLYQNLYYDGTYLYWSHQADNISTLYIINPTTGVIYDAGNFGEGVWPATGLYVNGSVAPASVDDGDETADVPVDEAALANLRPLATRDELLTADITARLQTEAAKFAVKVQTPAESEAEESAAEVPAADDTEENEEVTGAAETVETEEAVLEAAEEETEESASAETEQAEEPADEAAEESEEVSAAHTGGLNAVKAEAYGGSRRPDGAVRPLAAGASSETDGTTVTIILTEDVDVTNGFIRVTFDPASAADMSASSDLTYYSISLKESEGEIVFTYANKTALPAGTTLLTLTFTTSCSGSEPVVITTSERNAELTLSETKTVDVTAAAHDWADPTYEWAEDHSSVTAKFVCRNDEAHTTEVTADASSEMDEETGELVYTATVTGPDGRTYTAEQRIRMYQVAVRNLTGTKAPAALSIDEESWYLGEVTFTVECSLACVVAIKNGDGTYTRLTGTAEGDAHSFTVDVEDDSVEIVVVIKGDANLDGKISSKDSYLITLAASKAETLTEIQSLAADVTGDGKVNSKDSYAVTRAASKVTVFEWDAEAED